MLSSTPILSSTSLVIIIHYHPVKKITLYLSDFLQFNFRGLVPNDSILFYLRVRFTSAPLIPLSVN